MGWSQDQALGEKYKRIQVALIEGDFGTARKLCRDILDTPQVPIPDRIEQDGAVYLKCWNDEDQERLTQQEQRSGKPMKPIHFVADYHALALWVLAYLDVEENQTQRALDHLEQALALWPDQPNCLCEAAIALRNLGRNEEALHHYQRVIHQGDLCNPRTLAVALRGEGVLRIDRTELNEAEECLQASLQLDPENSLALKELNYIRQLRAGGPALPYQTIASWNMRRCSHCGRIVGGPDGSHSRYSPAGTRWLCPECQQVEARGDDPGDSIIEQASTLLEEGESEPALKLLFEYVRRCPGDLDGWVWLGIAYGRTGRRESAIRMFSKVLEKEPAHWPALFHLGLIHLALENPGEAEPPLRLALQQAPDMSTCWDALAQALEDQGKDREARALLEEAVNRFPDDVPLRLHLLWSFIRTEECEHGRATADWLEAHAAGDFGCLRAMLHFSLNYLDVERSRRMAETLWTWHYGPLLRDQALLRTFSCAFPAKSEHFIRSAPDQLVCPSCGTSSNEGELLGLVITADPIERLAVMATYKSGRGCACGLDSPREKARFILFPDGSIACIVSPGLREIPVLASPKRIPAGELGEPVGVRPRAGEWYLCEIPEISGILLHRAMLDLMRHHDEPGMAVVEHIWRLQEADVRSLDGIDMMAWFIAASFPESGESGRTEALNLGEWAESVISEIQVIAEQSLRADGEEPIRDDGRLPAWMLAERKELLSSRRLCSPWPLSHVCRCGADLRRYIFGTDPERLFDLDAVDEAALAGRKFVDPETGADWSGFVCDACGRVHSWSLGILPKDES